MDSTVRPEQIAEVLRNFDRKKEQIVNTETSERSLEAVSAIGTDTPLTVLIDIRQLLTEISNEVRLTNEILRQSNEYGSSRHREVLGYLQQVSDSIRTSQSISTAQIPLRPSTETSGSSESYYYRGDQIKTVHSVLGCIFLHLDAMVSKLSPSEAGSVDTAVMELKDWAGTVRILKEAESTCTPHNGILKLPSFTSTECKYALNVIASPTQGRAVFCKLEHMSDLMSTCPGIMNCIEEIRIRAVRCPGILSASRAKRMASISYPFITMENSINITEPNPKMVGSKIVLERVRAMNLPQKKIYVNEILKNGTKPMNASRIATEQSEKKVSS